MPTVERPDNNRHARISLLSRSSSAGSNPAVRSSPRLTNGRVEYFPYSFGYPSKNSPRVTRLLYSTVHSRPAFVTIPVARRLANTVLKSKGFRIAQVSASRQSSTRKRIIPGISLHGLFPALQFTAVRHRARGAREAFFRRCPIAIAKARWLPRHLDGASDSLRRPCRK